METQAFMKPPVQETDTSVRCWEKEWEKDSATELCPAESDSEQNTLAYSTEHHSMDTPNTFKGNHSHNSHRFHPLKESLAVGKPSVSEGAVHQPMNENGQVNTPSSQSESKQFIWPAFKVFVIIITIHISCCGPSFPQKDPPVEPELTLMMLGTSGAGKSAAGNTILGRKAFRAESSPVSVTKKCQEWTESVEGRRITVIDTPPITDMWQSPDKISRCIRTGSPGPHVFLPVFRLRTLTEDDRNFIKWIPKIFRDEALEFTMLLFTGGDQLEGKPIEKFLNEYVELQELVQFCGGRYHVLNNWDSKDFTQVSELLKKIDRMTYDSRSIFNISTVSMNEWRHPLKEEEERCRLEKENQIREEEEKKREEAKKRIREMERNRRLMKVRDVREEEEWKRMIWEIEIKKKLQKENQKKKSWWANIPLRFWSILK